MFCTILLNALLRISVMSKARKIGIGKANNRGEQVNGNGVPQQPPEIIRFYESPEMIKAHPCAAADPLGRTEVFERDLQTIQWPIIEHKVPYDRNEQHQVEIVSTTQRFKEGGAPRFGSRRNVRCTCRIVHL